MGEVRGSIPRDSTSFVSFFLVWYTTKLLSYRRPRWQCRKLRVMVNGNDEVLGVVGEIWTGRNGWC